MRLSKEQETEYRKVLSASHDEGFGNALRALLESELERVKELAITPQGGVPDMLCGEAQGYKKILKFLKERPVPTLKV